jgi:O-succinylbenzoate synthase
LDQLQQASPAICWDFMHQEPADFETRVRHETLDALAAALRRTRDDVKQAPAMGLDAAEKASILAALGASVPAENRGPTVAALRADGEPAAFCPGLRTMLRAALAMPAANRGPALRALLSGG